MLWRALKGEEMRFQIFRTMMVIVQTQHEICEVAEGYFENLFTTDGNEQLLAPFQVSSKTLCLRFWSLCGIDLFQYGDAWLKNGEFPFRLWQQTLSLFYRKISLSL